MALEDLIVNNTLLREILERIITPYLRFSADGTVSFLEPWFNIGSQKKVLLFLVAQEARRSLADKLPQREGPLSPRVIESELQMSGNTVRPRLKSLREAGYINCDRNGGYLLNIHMLPKIENYLGVEKEVKRNE